MKNRLEDTEWQDEIIRCSRCGRPRRRNSNYCRQGDEGSTLGWFHSNILCAPIPVDKAERVEFFEEYKRLKQLALEGKKEVNCYYRCGHDAGKKIVSIKYPKKEIILRTFCCGECKEEFEKEEE